MIHILYTDIIHSINITNVNNYCNQLVVALSDRHHNHHHLFSCSLRFHALHLSGVSLSQSQYIMVYGFHLWPERSCCLKGRKQCSVPGCQELVSHTTWHHHMDSHLKGVLSGAVPDASLVEEGLFVCYSCTKLVSTSHFHSHQQKCCSASSIPGSPPIRCPARPVLV